MHTLRRRRSNLYFGLAFLILLSLACGLSSPSEENGNNSESISNSGPTMTITPGSGPTGTNAEIKITGALANVAVTVNLDPGSTTGMTDANGEFKYTHTFNGQVGDISNVQATIGNANEQSASATFEITGILPTATPPPPIVTAAPSGPTLTVSPSRGPSGTTASITVTGALPNAPVLLELDPGSTNGTTDANGTWTGYTHTFFGQVGRVFNLKATIGGAGQQTASATFEITGELSQMYNAISDILSDKAAHGIHIRMLIAFVLNVFPGSIMIEGPDPWVTVVGEVADDGSFVATGNGTVAGFQDIAVVFEGNISMDHIAGEYTMGAEGGLPGGEPITYLIIGEADASSSASVFAAGFFDLYNAAQGAGDSGRMFEMLHPAVLELYGAAACTDYLASIVNPEVSIEVLSAADIGEWMWERDGQTLSIADALSVQANINNGGDVSQSELHLATRPDGTLGWFTDCGEPQG